MAESSSAAASAAEPTQDYNEAMRAKYAKERVAQQQRMIRQRALENRVKCLVCVNQTIAQSESEFAKEVKAYIKHELDQGTDDEDIMWELRQKFGDRVDTDLPLNYVNFLMYLAPPAVIAGYFYRRYTRSKNQNDFDTLLWTHLFNQKQYVGIAEHAMLSRFVMARRFQWRMFAHRTQFGTRPYYPNQSATVTRVQYALKKMIDKFII